MIQRLLHTRADPVLVDVVHGETLDVVLSKDAFFRRVDVAEANVHAALVGGWKEGDQAMGRGKQQDFQI
jgi:hypothetical protein